MVQDTWQNQGRQQHGWFGHGTSPHDDKPVGPDRLTRNGAAGTGAAHGGTRIILASASLAAPAMMGAGATTLASEIVGTAIAGGAAMPLVALAVVLAAGWGLYELMPAYDPGLIHEVRISGHPEVTAVMDERQGKVALAIPRPSGGTAAVVIWKVVIPSPLFAKGPVSPLIVDERDRFMGLYPLYGGGTILLTEDGAKALQEKSAQGGGAVAPQNDEQRRLVDGWKAEGKTPLEIQILLNAHQTGQGGGGAGAEQDKGKDNIDSRNKGLPEQLWTRKGYREAAIANDKPLADAIENGEVSGDGVQVHHVIPQASVKKDPDLFLAGGWSPDRLDNLVVLPKDPTAQQKIKDAINETRPTHNGSHGDWGKEVDEEIKKMKEDLRGKKLEPGTPDYDRAVSDGLNKLLQELRTRLMTKDKVSMIDQPHVGAA